MTVKIVFISLAMLSSAMGLIVLFNGESVAACFLVYQAALAILACAVGDLRMRMKRIEDYCTQMHHAREGSTSFNEPKMDNE